MQDPSANHSAEEPSTNELLDEYSLEDVQEAPTEELDISGLPIAEFIEPVTSHPAKELSEKGSSEAETAAQFDAVNPS